MMVTSTFKSRVIMPVIVLVVIMLVIAVIIYVMITNTEPVIGVAYVFVAFLIFAWACMFFGELRRRAIKVTIDISTITVNRYVGLGVDEIHYFSEFDGYMISKLESEYNSFEYLYIIRDGKKVIKISEFYHANYTELKIILARRMKNLGVLEYSFMRELKEFFQ